MKSADPTPSSRAEMRGPEVRGGSPCGLIGSLDGITSAMGRIYRRWREKSSELRSFDLFMFRGAEFTFVSGDAAAL